MAQMIDLISAGKLQEVTEYLLNEINVLKKAGSDFALMASNTPHIVFDAINKVSPLPLISIVESACDAAKKLSLKQVIEHH